LHFDSLRGRAAKTARPLALPRRFLRGPLSSGAWAGLLLFAPATYPVPAPKAVVPQAKYDFGRVRSGMVVRHDFRVRNAGDAELRFTGARMSLRGMTCRLPRAIAPGAEGKVSVELVTSHLQGHLKGEAALQSNDPVEPKILLELSGVVFGPLDVEPIPAVYLAAFRGQSVRRELTLVSNQPHPIDLRLLTPKGEHFTAVLRTIVAGKKFLLTVAPAAGTPPGRYEGKLALESEDPEIGRIELPVHVLVKNDLYAFPDSVDFGRVSIAQISRNPAFLGFLKQTILVKKRTGTFRILSITTDLPALTIAQAPKGSPSGTFKIDVGIAAEHLRPGSLDGTIRIRTDDPRFPELDVPVSGSIR
jgi:hypothetical protein